MSMHAVRIGTSSAVRMDDVGAAMVVESASLPMVSIWQFTWVDMTTKSNSSCLTDQALFSTPTERWVATTFRFLNQFFSFNVARR